MTNKTVGSQFKFIKIEEVKKKEEEPEDDQIDTNPQKKKKKEEDLPADPELPIHQDIDLNEIM
jgi:hypothetical protein